MTDSQSPSRSSSGSPSGRTQERHRYRKRSLHQRMPRSSFRFVGGVAAVLAALTLFAGIGEKWFADKSLPPARAVPAPTANSASSTRPHPPAPFATDDAGFVNSPARCDGTQTALALGRTGRSVVVICADQHGDYDYRGVRISDGALLKVPAQATADGGYLAENEGVTYAVSSTQLLVTSGQTVISREPMIEYRQPRPFAAETGAAAPKPQTTSAPPAAGR